MRNTKLFIWILFLGAFQSIAQGQAADKLPRSLPETQGVSSADIEKFIDAASSSKNEFHSFMLLRHGKVISEGWWAPYSPSLRHSLYSCSKSFTATAIGLALNEKKLSLSDKVISFFPEYLPDTVSSYLSELTVKDVLMMSDGQEPDPSFTVASRDSNWVKGFLSTPIIHQPGSVFLYNSLGTYMLSAIVQKVTGETTLSYLKPRLFEPLGITGMDWEMDTRGINTGGWGLRLKTEDMAKFAQLFLQKGQWNGKQVLPASWVEEASSFKILQEPNASSSKRDSSDWLQGYCYQMWRCRHGAYRGDGAFGQYMIVLPEQDAAIAITSETADMQDELNLVWKYLLPAFKKDKLPLNPAASQSLDKKLKALATTRPAPHIGSMESLLAQKNFLLNENPGMYEAISLGFSNGTCHLRIKIKGREYPLDFGDGKWIFGLTQMHGPSLVAGSIENTSMLYPAKVCGAYTWLDDHTLSLVLRYIESPHTETLTCRFEGDQVQIDLAKSFDFGKKSVLLHGQSK